MARLDEIEQMEDDLFDLALATARLLTDGGERVSLDALLTHYGLSRDELAEESA